MQFLKSLTLKNFRNFADAAFDLSEQRMLFTGPNGSGKSNLFEAIYFLAIAKSHRNATDAEVVRYGQEELDICATIAKTDYSFVSRIYYHPQTGKRAFVDSKVLPRLSDLIGTFNAVLFSPEEVDVVMRSPPKRRRTLDILAAQAHPAHIADLQAYRRVVAQRNHLLRSSDRRVTSASLDPWDRQLSDLGSRIVHWRCRVVERMSPYVASFYERLFPDDSRRLCVSYRTVDADTTSLGSISEALMRCLADARRREASIGRTICGPHLDVLVFSLDGHDVQDSASQGQLKSVLASWKLSEAIFLEEEAGVRPVILLDDVFSELDAQRCRTLLDIIDSFGQVFLTSARDSDIAISEHGFKAISLGKPRQSYSS